MPTLMDIENALGKDVAEVLANIEARKEAKETLEATIKADIDFGTLVTVKRNTFRGVVKVLGMVYNFTKDRSTVWVETSEDIYKADIDAVEVAKAKEPQAKKGFNDHKTKLNEIAVKDIYFMATTSKMNHKLIASWVYIHHGIEIVPKTVSDIKLGKRWGKVTSTLGKGACDEA